MQLQEHTSFDGTLEALLKLYEEAGAHFNTLPPEQRKQMQPPKGKDGIFGPNTFRYMLKENLVSGLASVKEAVEEVTAGDERVKDDT